MAIKVVGNWLSDYSLSRVAEKTEAVLIARTKEILRHFHGQRREDPRGELQSGEGPAI